MMAGNPSWWNMHSNLRSSTPSDHHHHHQANGSPNLLLSQTHPSASLLPVHYPHDHDGQDSPHSWSQLLLGGLASEQEERFGLNLFQSTRVMSTSLNDVKQEMATPNHHHNNNNNLYGYHQEQEAGVSNRLAAWSQNMPASSPKSCVTSLNSINNNNNNNNSNNNTMLDFSTNNRSLHDDSHQHVDHSNSECNSNMTGGASNKKPKVQSIATPPLKVRKEKLGDRITALHQLVSPFGKTDTASVLLEAIGYIRFLQGQIEALSSPYLGNNNASAKNQHSAHCDRNCLFPDHPGQLLNDSCLKTRATTIQEEYKDAQRDLKSRGLCLVPLSCTQIVGNDNGADYWAPSFGGGF